MCQSMAIEEEVVGRNDFDAGESSSNEVYFILAKMSSENEKHFISTRGMEKTEIERY